MNHDTPAYGLWSLVVINTAVLLIFAFSFTHPRTARDWRSFGAFAAFLVALFQKQERKTGRVLIGENGTFHGNLFPRAFRKHVWHSGCYF